MHHLNEHMIKRDVNERNRFAVWKIIKNIEHKYHWVGNQ